MTSNLQTTSLYQEHLALKARIVPFAGYQMPVQYTSIIDEHNAVRQHSGMFDVSHMGRLYFSGADARDVLQRVLTWDVDKIEVGHARYQLVCEDSGGILDDVILYRMSENAYFLVCNASNHATVRNWIDRRIAPSQMVHKEDHTESTAMIALQGPEAVFQLATLLKNDKYGELPYFQWAQAGWQDLPLFIARTGYTGEDGYELVVPAHAASMIWRELLNQGVVPCGLGARDTLRLEAALPLHGNDISLETNAMEAGLMWTVDLDKEFIGKAAILQAKEHGVDHRLVCFEVSGRVIPRSHCDLLSGGEVVGHSSSGGYSPTLQKGIGMGYIPPSLTKPGTELEIDVRGTRHPAVVVPRPFYKRAT